jgi:hypothetical protein
MFGHVQSLLRAIFGVPENQAVVQIHLWLRTISIFFQVPILLFVRFQLLLPPLSKAATLSHLILEGSSFTNNHLQVAVVLQILPQQPRLDSGYIDT